MTPAPGSGSSPVRVSSPPTPADNSSARRTGRRRCPPRAAFRRQGCRSTRGRTDDRRQRCSRPRRAREHDGAPVPADVGADEQRAAAAPCERADDGGLLRMLEHATAVPRSGRRRAAASMSSGRRPGPARPTASARPERTPTPPGTTLPPSYTQRSSPLRRPSPRRRSRRRCVGWRRRRRSGRQGRTPTS